MVATLGTYSRVLILQEAERERLLAQIRDYLASRPETAAGQFTVPLVTAAIRAVRRWGRPRTATRPAGGPG